jgi:hypothetical protein
MKFLIKDRNGHTGVFTLGNETQLRADTNELSDEMKITLMMHGLMQKIGDGASGYSKAQDYAGALGEMEAIWNGLKAGQWTRKGGGTGTSDLVQAIMNLTGKERDEVQAVIDKMDDKKLALTRKRKDVTAEIKRLQLERAKAAAKVAEEEADLADLF